MNLFSHFRDEIVRVLGTLAAEGRVPAGLDLSKVAAEPPREAGHGDIATNAAINNRNSTFSMVSSMV